MFLSLELSFDLLLLLRLEFFPAFLIVPAKVTIFDIFIRGGILLSESSRVCLEYYSITWLLIYTFEDLSDLLSEDR